MTVQNFMKRNKTRKYKTKRNKATKTKIKKKEKRERRVSLFVGVSEK